MGGSPNQGFGGKPGGCGDMPKGVAVWSQKGMVSSRGSLIWRAPWSSKTVAGHSGRINYHAPVK